MFNPLVRACYDGDVECVRALLQSEGRAALEEAMHEAMEGSISQNRSEILRLLIESEACTEELFAKRDGGGRTLLHYAAWGGDSPMLEALLLSDKITTEMWLIKDPVGDTPLHRAALSGNSATMEVLLRSEKITTEMWHIENNGGNTPLYIAAWSDDLTKVDALFSSEKFGTRMWKACCDGDMDRLRELLLQGEESEALPFEVPIAIIWASRRQHTEILKPLLGTRLRVESLRHCSRFLRCGRRVDRLSPGEPDLETSLWSKVLKPCVEMEADRQAARGLRSILTAAEGWLGPYLGPTLIQALEANAVQISTTVLEAVTLQLAIVEGSGERLSWTLDAKKIRPQEPPAFRRRTLELIGEDSLKLQEGSLTIRVDQKASAMGWFQTHAFLVQLEGTGVLRPCSAIAVPSSLATLAVVRAMAQTTAHDALGTGVARVIISNAFFDYRPYIQLDVVLIYMQTLAVVMLGWRWQQTGATPRPVVFSLLLWSLKEIFDEFLQQRMPRIVRRRRLTHVGGRWPRCWQRCISICCEWTCRMITTCRRCCRSERRSPFPSRNMVDLLRIGLGIITCARLLGDGLVSVTTQACLATWTAWSWLRCLWALRGFRFIGPKMLPVIYAVRGVFGFVTVLLFTVIAATNAYFVFGLRTEPSTWYASFLVVFRLAILGDVDLFEWEGLDPVLVQQDTDTWEPEDPLPSKHYVWIHVLFYAIALFMTVILMNVFIGILGNNYDLYQDKSEELFMQSRAEIVADSFHTSLWRLLHCCFGQDLDPEGCFYERPGLAGWRIFLEPVEEAPEDRQATERSLRTTVKQVETSLDKAIDKKFEVQQKAMDKKLQSMDKKLEALDTKLTEILDHLRKPLPAPDHHDVD
mmetsp:Transcript_25452/g.46596  ORF Transcript_25452/g.46596 Transcript_25452/m.46596 type:complete len:866 (-) Transcript_25452:127-2724(-)